MRKKLTQAQCPVSFLLTEPCYGKTYFYTAHERECDPNLPLTMTFLFYVYGREEGEKSREKEGTRLQPQYVSHRIWSGPNWRQWFLAPWVRVNLRPDRTKIQEKVHEDSLPVHLQNLVFFRRGTTCISHDPQREYRHLVANI